MNAPRGSAPTPAPEPPTPGSSGSGLRGVGRIMGLNLGVLALYLVPALILLGLNRGLGQLGEFAAFFTILVPFGHGFLSMLVGLIALLTGRRDLGAGLMISGPIILIIAFSSCLGALGLMAH